MSTFLPFLPTRISLAASVFANAIGKYQQFSTAMEPCYFKGLNFLIGENRHYFKPILSNKLKVIRRY